MERWAAGPAPRALEDFPEPLPRDIGCDLQSGRVDRARAIGPAIAGSSTSSEGRCA